MGEYSKITKKIERTTVGSDFLLNIKIEPLINSVLTRLVKQKENPEVEHRIYLRI